MSREGPDCKFSNSSIVSWRNKFKNFDIPEYFGRRQCSIARGVVATGAIKNISLADDVAVINAYFNGETINFEIRIESSGVLKTTIDKLKITSQIVTIAALMEIEALINKNEEPQISDSETQPLDVVPENVSSISSSGSSIVSKQSELDLHPSKVDQKTIKKNVLVKFEICGDDVVMCAFLDNSIKKPIFMQSSSSLTVIAGDEKKMALLRLLFYAKKSKFEFCSGNRDYRLKNLRDAVDLMRDKFEIWNKYFFIELSSEMLLLKRGIIFPTICAKVRDVDEIYIKIEWLIETPYGYIRSEKMSDLLRANGRSIFIDDIGAVALTVNQISRIRQVFANRSDAKLSKYMLYTLLNQNAIKVDTTGCKISHIDVGSVKFPLPEFLKNYQKDGVYSMRAILDAGCHCLLADEMGLGKTLQVLSLICSNESPSATLVICPASVISVWQHEVSKFFPSKTFGIVDKFYDFSKKCDFLLCSYSQVHKLNKELCAQYFDYIVLDEAQYIKNPRSKTTLSCCNIRGKHRIAVTGTPIENNLVDVWSIFKFLMPGFFCGFKQFLQQVEYQDFRTNFQKQLSTFTIRRTKQSVAIELPKRNELEIICDMTLGQRRAYDLIKSDLKSTLRKFHNGNSRSRMHILTGLIRLRQAACAQFILPESLRHDNSRESNKLESLMIKLEAIIASGQKAVIFSQFLEFLAEIKTRIMKNLPETKFCVLTGETVNRNTVVEDFQNFKGGAIMLISLKAGGVGITLHAAEYAFLMEPWWNPAVEDQAIARIHRIGQKKITTIYRMVTSESIEERMREIQSSKTELFNEFIKTGADNIALTNFYLKNLEALLD